MKIAWLTNHLLVLGALVAAEVSVFAVLLVLGVPDETALRLAIHLWSWAQTVWVFAVAIELNIFNLRARKSIFGWLAVSGLFLAVASAFSPLPAVDSSAGDETFRILVVLFASAHFTFAACIADRISSSLFSRIGAFYGLLSWPIFLFLLSSSIRAAAKKLEQVSA